MKILITGGAGFIGLRLASRIAELGHLTGVSGKRETVEEILLFDQGAPPQLPPGLAQKARFLSGDISDRDIVFSLVDRDDISIFHLASVVSGGGEKSTTVHSRTACSKSSRRNAPSAARNAIRFREARLHAVSSRNMYSEQGFDALIRPEAGQVCQSLMVVWK